MFLQRIIMNVSCRSFYRLINMSFPRNWNVLHVPSFQREIFCFIDNSIDLWLFLKSMVQFGSDFHHFRAVLWMLNGNLGNWLKAEFLRGFWKHKLAISVSKAFVRFLRSVNKSCKLKMFSKIDFNFSISVSVVEFSVYHKFSELFN